MPTEVQITFSPGLRKLMAQSPAQVILPAIAKAMDEENEVIVGATVEERLSFSRDMPTTPEGLRVQTGLLRKSLRRANAVIRGNTVTSSIGSNVKYFGVHEFGFDGDVQIKEHTRKAPDRVKLAESGEKVVSLGDAARLGILTRKGRPRKGTGELVVGGEHRVKAHTRKAHFPARRMLHRTVESRADEYAQTIHRHVLTALGQGGSE